MVYVFFILFLASIVFLVGGLFKPSFAIRWGKNPTRIKVILIYSLAALCCLALIGLTAPELPEEQEMANAEEVLEEEKMQTGEEAIDIEEERQIEEEKALSSTNQEEQEKEIEIISTDFNNFKEQYTSLTDLQKDELWLIIKGKYVQWSGKVHNVDKNSIRIKLKDYHLGGFDFEVYVADEQKDLLLSIKKDSIITVQGKLHKRSTWLSSWTLTEAIIIR